MFQSVIYIMNTIIYKEQTMKKKTLFMIAGVTALGAYSFFEGKGPFNKLKYKEQHDALSRYVETHYPKALYSPITKTKNGYMSIIRSLNMQPIVLYFEKTEDGTYIFNETEASFS